MKENTLRVLKEIKNKASCIFYWFPANYFKENPKKSHVLLTSDEELDLNLKV